MSFSALALIAPEPRHAHRRAAIPRTLPVANKRRRARVRNTLPLSRRRALVTSARFRRRGNPGGRQLRSIRSVAGQTQNAPFVHNRMRGPERGARPVGQGGDFGELRACRRVSGFGVCSARRASLAINWTFNWLARLATIWSCMLKRSARGLSKRSAQIWPPTLGVDQLCVDAHLILIALY